MSSRAERARRILPAILCIALLAGCREDAGAPGALRELGAAAVASVQGTAEASPLAPAAEAREAPEKRTYYQYIDDQGSVRFVSSRDQVPPQWRDRAGSVEMDSKPPEDRADHQAALDRRRARARAVLEDGQPQRARSEVRLYYAKWCPYCRKAKAHLDARGVAYQLLDVDDPRIKAELRAKTGSGGIPVLDVGGELVRGFDPEAMDRLIAAR